MEAPSRRSAPQRYLPLCLSRVLKPGARGAPPAQTRAHGIAGMSPADMQRRRVALGQPVLVRGDGAKAVAVLRAWPLVGVREGGVALDEPALEALGVEAAGRKEGGGERRGGSSEVGSGGRPGRHAKGGRTPRKKESGRRRGGSGGDDGVLRGHGRGHGRARGGGDGDGGDDTDMDGGVNSLSIQTLEEDDNGLDDAARIRVSVVDTCEKRGDGEGDGEGGAARFVALQRNVLREEEIALHVRSEISGRYVTAGSVCCVSVLGKLLRLVVLDVSCVLGAEVARVTRETTVEVVESEVVQKGEVQEVAYGIDNMSLVDDSGGVRGIDRAGAGLKDIGGLSAQVNTVLHIARMAFSGVRSCAKNEFDDGGMALKQKSLCKEAKRPRGVLLYGPPGCGKTMVARAVSEACNASLFMLSGPDIVGALSGESEAKVASVFRKAFRQRPAVVVLDEVDAIAPRRDGPAVGSTERRLTASLLTLLDGGGFGLRKDGSDRGSREIAADGVFVVATTNIPDAIDPAMRRAGRLGQEVEIPVPSAAARFDILKRLTGRARDAGRLSVSEETLREISRVAHGLAGADLAAVWRECVSSAQRRALPSSEETSVDDSHSKAGSWVVERCDFDAALLAVKPSALREVEVEVPRIRWADIGGMEEAKARLREAIELPLSVAGAKLLGSVGISAPRGLLLFGPPGCSKTLLAKAVATESGANFISVKGPELLSKWVGESEKAIRATFRRARASAPCVVFFDEIDGLAQSRGVGGSAQSRVVAQLLTEMDGIGADGLKDCPTLANVSEEADAWMQSSGRGRVVVVAATNRPDLLDPALLRPGRLGLQIYVGLPNAKERAAILDIHMSHVPAEKSFDICRFAADGGATDGMSGAELASLVREAALAAMEEDVEGASQVGIYHFELAGRRVRPRTPLDVVSFFEKYLQSARNVS